MKKLLLTLALIISVLALSAQRIVVTEEATGNVVTSGASYYIFGDGSEFSWGYPGGQLEIAFNVTATADINLIAQKVENNVIEGTQNDFCLDVCFSQVTYISPAITFANGVSKEFSAHYLALVDYLEVLGMEQSMTYYIYEEGNPDEKFEINITFVYSYANVEDYSKPEVFGNAYPMPASNMVNFDYNFSNSVNAEIAIYNMMGQEVLRNDINGVSGTASLNVSDLADGIYFYSLIVNGKTEKSSKLVIRK